MSLRHKIDAALLSTEGLKFAGTVVPPAAGQTIHGDGGPEEGANPLASMAANAGPEGGMLDPAELAYAIQRMIARAGIPQEPSSPLTQLPEADPAILSNVLQRARVARDPTDYLRLLSHDSEVNEMARMAALPALLLTDALAGRGTDGARTRETVIDVLRNLQLPAMTPARGPAGPSFQGSIPSSSRAYPPWYPR